MHPEALQDSCREVVPLGRQRDSPGSCPTESYGYQTVFANRIGEIQGSTSVQDWWWIPGPPNITDIISRGANPKELDEGTDWQLGPKFLSLAESEWPVKSAKDVSAEARENLTRIQKKAFVAALTRAGATKEPKQESISTSVDLHRPPPGVVATSLLDIKRFSRLTGLIRSLTLVWRASKRFLRGRAGGRLKWEAVPLTGIITVAETDYAFRDLCLAAQERAAFPSTTTDRLVVYRDEASGLLLCGGRIQYCSTNSLSHLAGDSAGMPKSSGRTRRGCSDSRSLGLYNSESCQPVRSLREGKGSSVPTGDG